VTEAATKIEKEYRKNRVKVRKSAVGQIRQASHGFAAK
jgi:hypothetical protein